VYVLYIYNLLDIFLFVFIVYMSKDNYRQFFLESKEQRNKRTTQEDYCKRKIWMKVRINGGGGGMDTILSLNYVRCLIGIQ